MKYWLPLLLLALNHSVLAQEEIEDKEPEQERIYKVELIIFERLQEDKAFDAETWPANLQLSYPLNWERLVDPALEKERIERQLIEEERRASLALSEDFTHVFASGEPAPKAGDPIELDSAPATPDETTSPDKNDVSQPKYYQFLSGDQRDLAAQEKALSQSRSLRTLFHQAWIQPMLERENAPALLVKGGNLYGEHYELEGSFTLSVARYLHLNTNFWLSEYAPNVGQTPDYWFSLPQRPDRIFDSAQPTELTDISNSGASAFTFTTELAAFDSDADIESISGTPFNFGMNSRAQAEQPYLITQIISVEQKRRMRSGELHYLDHPRLGVLIKITPFEAPAEAKPSAS